MPDKLSFDEKDFNSSYRKLAFDKDYNSNNQFEVNIELIRDKLTGRLLKNINYSKNQNFILLKN